MRVMTLGSTTPAATTPQKSNKVAIFLGHVVLQAVFIAPGLYLAGVKGWRLPLASLAGSATFTGCIYAWSVIEGMSMVGAAELSSMRRQPRAPSAALPPEDPDVIDVSTI